MVVSDVWMNRSRKTCMFPFPFRNLKTVQRVRFCLSITTVKTGLLRVKWQLISIIWCLVSLHLPTFRFVVQHMRLSTCVATLGWTHTTLSLASSLQTDHHSIWSVFCWQSTSLLLGLVSLKYFLSFAPVVWRHLRPHPFHSFKSETMVLLNDNSKEKLI